MVWAGPAETEAAAYEIRQLGKAREAARSLQKRAEAAAADIKATELKSYSESGKITSKGQWSVPDRESEGRYPK